MDYFISVDNTPYYQWQLELFIESFKNINLENKLVIGLNKNCQFKFYNKNILNHKKTYCFSNMGDLKGYEPLNKLYFLSESLKKEYLKQPFTMFFDIDLIIKKELNLPFTDGAVDFSYFIDPFFTFEEAEKNYPNFWKILNLNKNECQDNWICLGEMFSFNNFPITFFDRLIFIAEKLIVHQLLESKEILPKILNLALILTLLENHKKIRISKNNNLIMPAMSIGDSHFISYKQGILPDFHKLMFLFNPPEYFSLGDPIEILSTIYNCPNTKYISELTKKILSNNIVL